MKIAIVAATSKEWEPAYAKKDENFSKKNRLTFSFHETGVGVLAATVSLMQLIAEEKPDIIIQIGIAGCFDQLINPGKTVLVKDEILGDSGVLENGQWKDMFDMKLANKDNFPFENKRLFNPHLAKLNMLNLDEVTAITVSEVTTASERINQLKEKYNPLLETMEGAVLHYVGLKMDIPFIQLRAISNYVGERNKEKWMITEAIESLNETLLNYIDALHNVYK